MPEILVVIVFAVMLTVFVALRTALGSSAREKRIEQLAEQRIEATVQAMQQEEAERNSGGWRPPSGPQGTPTPNIAPRVHPTQAAPALPEESPATGEVAAGMTELPAELRARVLELMEQKYEVGAVRLVCDEMGVGILDAQKTVRTLAGHPTL